MPRSRVQHPIDIACQKGLPVAPSTSTRRRVRLILALASLLTAVSLLVVLESRPVRIADSSMETTYSPGDLVTMDTTSRSLYESVVGRPAIIIETPDGGNLVTRVIARPGDHIAVLEGNDPKVFLRVARADATYLLRNARWLQGGSSSTACCASDGRSRADHEPAWIRVPDNSYWVIGDNWARATDSRKIGFVDETDIKGIVQTSPAWVPGLARDEAQIEMVTVSRYTLEPTDLHAGLDSIYE